MQGGGRRGGKFLTEEEKQNQPPMSIPVSTSMMLPVRMDGNRLATEEITMHTSTSASWRQ